MSFVRTHPTKELALIDYPALALMLGGTLLATLLQAGLANSAIALASLGSLLRPGFDPAKTRAELSRQIGDLDRDGLVRARRAPIHDAEFDNSTAAMIRMRSLDALLAEHEASRALRFARATSARAVCHQAAELAQMMGLAGTLLSLGQLGPLAGATGANGVAGAIGMAVTTTLYGVIIANMVFVPLAGMIERRARAEDRAREDLFQWLEEHAARAAPRLADIPQPPHGRAAA